MQLKTPVFCNGIRGYGFNIWSKGSKEKRGINSGRPFSVFILHAVSVRKRVQPHAAACLVYFCISAKCRAKSKQPMPAARTRIYMKLHDILCEFATSMIKYALYNYSRQGKHMASALSLCNHLNKCTTCMQMSCLLSNVSVMGRLLWSCRLSFSEAMATDQYLTQIPSRALKKHVIICTQSPYMVDKTGELCSSVVQGLCT